MNLSWEEKSLADFLLCFFQHKKTPTLDFFSRPPPEGEATSNTKQGTPRALSARQHLAEARKQRQRFFGEVC
jgi:hypothetical protein